MWREQIDGSIRDVRDAAQRLRLPPRVESGMARAATRYPILVTPYYFGLIDPENPRDPIRRMVLPSPAELWHGRDEIADPLEECRFCPASGLIHKYRNRVLILVTSVCAVHCRFCFRAHSGVTPSDGLSAAQFDRILGYIRKRRGIQEVILSGGDPLMMDDEELGVLIDLISGIDHVEVIRIHTRMPAVLPQRLTAGLAGILRRGKPVWVVAHFNHAVEMTGEAERGCAVLIDAGIPMLNQAVLLRGVNDSTRALMDLSGALVRNRIKPYYLHQLDKVAGAGHFAVDDMNARIMVSELAEKVSGYAVPTLVREIPGRSCKTVL